MSESEAYYKIFPNMNLKYSSIDTIFIPSDKKELRSIFLRKLDDDDIDFKYGTEVKAGREGLFHFMSISSTCIRNQSVPVCVDWI